jgi:IS5 family transposase
VIKSPGIESTLSKSGDFMQPKTGYSNRGDLFRSRLDQILNHRHPLYRQADCIDWSLFDREFGSLYVENFGRPGLPIRLLVGLHYFKHAYNVSDEAVVERFLENPYWQYLCGFEYFQHKFPLDPTTLVMWRKRIGPKGIEKLLQVTIETAKNKRNTWSGSTSIPQFRRRLLPSRPMPGSTIRPAASWSGWRRETA